MGKLNKKLNITHVVKSECLRSITLRYGAYYSILAYATYQTEYQKSGATKSILQLKVELAKLDISCYILDQLNGIIDDTYRFVEEGVVTKKWTTYNQNIRKLFNSDEQTETQLTLEKALEHYEDIKCAVELRSDLILEQIKETNYGY